MPKENPISVPFNQQDLVTHFEKQLQFCKKMRTDDPLEFAQLSKAGTPETLSLSRTIAGTPACLDYIIGSSSYWQKREFSSDDTRYLLITHIGYIAQRVLQLKKTYTDGIAINLFDPGNDRCFELTEKLVIEALTAAGAPLTEVKITKTSSGFNFNRIPFLLVKKVSVPEESLI